LECDGISIAYIPSTRLVNATHLLKVGHKHRFELRKFLSRHPQIPTEAYLGRYIGGRSIAGTYITYEDAVLVCQFFTLRSDPIEQLLKIGSGPEPNIIEYDGHGEVDEDEEAAFQGISHPREVC
jgi:hypothetical protein